jgi:hypothetical protein
LVLEHHQRFQEPTVNSHLLAATARARVEDFRRNADGARLVQSEAQLRRARPRRSSSDRSRLGLRSLRSGLRVVASR